MAWALLSVLTLPLTALKETYEEARDLLLKWRQHVVEYQQELQKRQVPAPRGRWSWLSCALWGWASCAVGKWMELLGADSLLAGLKNHPQVLQDLAATRTCTWCVQARQRGTC